MINFNLIKNKRLIWTLSSFLITFSFCGILFSSFYPPINNPINLGIDFVGGTEIRINRICSNECSELIADEIIDKLRLTYDDQQFLNNITIQIQDNYNLISIRTLENNILSSKELLREINEVVVPLDFSSEDYRDLGAKIGPSLLLSGAFSLVIALLSIAIYLSIRFDGKYAFLALIALFHDLLIVFGTFSWLGILFSVEVNSLFAVSLLTIAGYSVNDTVVIFDRIRENVKSGKNIAFDNLIQNSVNESFRRTIFTSITTLIPLVSIMIFGSYTLFWFSVALALGIVIGSYSSILLAPSLLLKNK